MEFGSANRPPIANTADILESYYKNHVDYGISGLFISTKTIKQDVAISY